MWLSWLIEISAAATAQLAASPLETPPLPPGLVCGAMRTLDLRDVPLTADTDRAQVAAAWGEPGTEGPAQEVAQYWLTCDARLWLSFEPNGPRRLKRAILFTGSFVPQATVIVDDLPITRTRRCEQLPLGRPIDPHRVAAAWGPPDNLVGSGIVRWTYSMADGGTAQVFPDNYPRSSRVTIRCTTGTR
jgi:hypothetical protein